MEKEMIQQPFKWRVSDFSKKKETAFCSKVFLAAGHRWRILIFPKGEDAGDTRVGYLSVYLGMVDGETMRHVLVEPETMRRGWSVSVDFSLTVVNQTDPASSVKRGSRVKFIEGEDECGWKSFVRLSDLRGQGFLLDDALLIEARVSTHTTKRQSARPKEAATAKSKGTEAYEPDEEELDDDMIKRPNTSLSPNRQADDHDHSSADEPSPVELTTSRDVEAGISAMNTTTTTNSSSSGSSFRRQKNSFPSNPHHRDGISASLRPKREKLVEFFSMPLEAISQTKSFDEVHNLILQIAAHAATVPSEKRILNQVVSRVAEFKNVVPSSMSAIEASHVIESVVGEMMRDMEARLDYWKRQVALLEAEISRLEEEEGKRLEEEGGNGNDVRKAKFVDQRNSTLRGLERASREASKEVEELRKRRREREEAGEKRMRAEEKLAHCNASWKVFKRNLGW